MPFLDLDMLGSRFKSISPSMALLRDCGIGGSVGGAQVGGKYRTTLKRAPAIVEKIRSLQQLANKARGPVYPALPVRANTIGIFRYHYICAPRASVALMESVLRQAEA